jgi:hypothetical protein
MQPVVNHSLIHRKTTIPPVVTTPPSIAGATAIGSILTLTPGVWVGADTVTRQWMANGTPIAGQTGLSFTTTAAEAGKDINVEETATNVSGSAATFSNTIVVDTAAAFNAAYSDAFDNG